jgi:cAMP-specific phosphodiesterase 4/calcium/calmodulin-dependent 3',5'-cyclic nucleotide phosphodiesterase
MHDPVVLVDGHTYERCHIERWLESNDTSPVTGVKLSQIAVFPNHSLRNAIEEYFDQVLGDHRQAIKRVIQGLQRRNGFSSSAALVHAIGSLMQCAVLVSADLSIEKVLAKIMQEAKSLVGAEVASVFLVDREQNDLYSTVNSTGGELRVPMNSVAGAVACSGNPLIIENAYGDSRFNAVVDSKTGFTTRNILCVPIRAWKGGIIGVAQLINKTIDGALVSFSSQGSCSEDDLSFGLDDQHFLEVLATQAGAAVINSGMFSEMPHLPIKSMSLQSHGESKTIRPPLCAPVTDFEIPVAKEQSKSHAASTPAVQKGEQVGLSAKQRALIKPVLVAATQNFEMDTLSLAELTGSKPLSVLAIHLFEHHGLPEFFQMDHQKLEQFMMIIEQGYPVRNQYHNRAHAASVLHVMHSLLCHGGVLEASGTAAMGVDDKERQQKVVMLAALLAAVVHDFEHEGVNNDFLVKTGSKKAMRYNDRSPNENHHVAAAWGVLQREDCNFLASLCAEEARILRKLVVDMVLSTDMAEHGTLLKSFKEGSNSATPFIPTSPEGARLSLQLALKCADLGHLSLCWTNHLRWVRLLEEEFFAQGDREAKHEMLEISFLMDRSKPGASDTQMGFFDFVVLPLFRALAAAFPSAQPILTGVESNYETWKSM